MTLELISFLDMSSVKHVIVCWGGILNAHPVKNLPTSEFGQKKKTESQMRTS